jgi:DNA-directed RNA polymerase I subunit RPA49
VLNGLLTRFAESVGKKYTVTDKMRTKLLAWICTLYILLDGWSVEIGKVAKELSISDAKFVLTSSLGQSEDVADSLIIGCPTCTRCWGAA